MQIHRRSTTWDFVFLNAMGGAGYQQESQETSRIMHKFHSWKENTVSRNAEVAAGRSYVEVIATANGVPARGKMQGHVRGVCG